MRAGSHRFGWFHASSSPGRYGLPLYLLAMMGIEASGMLACSQPMATGPKSPGIDNHPIKITVPSCDIHASGAQAIDGNGDGKPDVVTLSRNGQPYCRVDDLNHDGKTDRIVMFDSSGKPAQVVSDYDFDGRFDESAFFDGGIPSKKYRAMNELGRFDTWLVYKDGHPYRQDRDSNDDGKVDEWWTYYDPAHPDCVRIKFDHNGDGEPDPHGDYDSCSQDDGSGAPLPSPSSSSSTAPASSATPPSSAPSTSGSPPPSGASSSSPPASAAHS